MKDKPKSRAKLEAFLGAAPVGAVALRVTLFRKGTFSEEQRPHSAHIDWVAANGETRRETLHPNPKPITAYLWPRVFVAARRANVGVERYVVADTLMREKILVERWPARDFLRANAQPSAPVDGYREGSTPSPVTALREAGFSVERVAGDVDQTVVSFERVQRPQPLWLLMTPLVILSCAWVVMLPKFLGFLNQVKVLTITGQTVRHEYIVGAEELRVLVHASGDLAPAIPLVIPLRDILAFSAPNPPSAARASVITASALRVLPLPHEVKVSNAPLTRARAKAVVTFLESHIRGSA